MNKKTVVYPYDVILLSNKKSNELQATKWKNLNI